MNIASTTKTQVPAKVVSQQATKTNKEEPAGQEPKESFSFAESYANHSRSTVATLLKFSPAIGGGFAGYKLGGSVGGGVGSVVGAAAGVIGGGVAGHKLGVGKMVDTMTSKVDSKLSPESEALLYGSLEAGIGIAIGGVSMGAAVSLGTTLNVGFDYLSHRSEQKKQAG